MAGLSLHLLGPFQASLSGQLVTGFESSKARALLAYLAMEANRPHLRNHLANLLWPGLPEAPALGNLRHALANLHRVLGDHEGAPPYIQKDHQCLQFDLACDHCLDVAAFTQFIEDNSRGPSDFEQLERAISLYRGDFLEGFDLDGCAEFEEWVLLRREGCRWLLMTALQLVCEHHLRAGHFDAAIQRARQMVHRDPWDEVAHQYLMRALAAAGHRADALRQYHDCRRLLLAELQVEPSATTTALYEEIRNGAAPAISPRASPPAPPSIRGLAVNRRPASRAAWAQYPE